MGVGRRRGARFAMAVAAAWILAAGLWASPAAPRGDYRVIATADFDIIYPAQAAGAAARLAERAEDILAELAAWFPKPAWRRIPVVIALDEMSANAYFSDLPSPHILLQAAPSSLSSTIGAYDDYLLRIFRHELIHALSLLQRAGAYEVLAFLFGDALAPAMVSAPEFMREGPTVSLEGGGGAATGRTADPLIAHYLRQDLIEGRFRTPAEAWSAYGRYPGGEVHYYYGGFFSAWLQREYGMDRYARLWAEMGTGEPFDALGAGAFRAAYGMGLDEAWAAFAESMRPRGAVSMDIRPVAAAPLGRYSALAPLGDGIVYADQERNAVFYYDPAKGAEERLFDADWTVEGLAAAAGAGARTGKLVVDSGRVVDGRLELGARVFDLAARRFEATWIEGAQEACATADGYLAIVAGTFTNDIVAVGSDGARRVVARGGPERRFSDLAYVGGRYAYCLACQGAERFVARVDLETGALARLALPRGLAFARWLSPAPGDSLLLALPGDDGFYRLARLAPGSEASAATLRVERAARSGAVTMPVAFAGGVAYRGLFSRGQALMLHPDPALADADAFEAAWTDWEIPAAEEAATEAALVAAHPSAPYAALAYLAPRLTVPSLSLRDGALRLGATTSGAEPTENLDWSLQAGWSWGSDFVDLSARMNGLSFSDSANLAQRATGVRLAGSTFLPLFPSWRGFSLAGELGFSAVAPAAAGSPYGWAYARSVATGWGEAGFVSLPGRAYSDSAEPSGFALYLSLSAARPLDAPAAAPLSAVAEGFFLGKLGPLELRASAAWAPGMSMSSGGWASYASGAYSFGLGARYGGIYDYSLPDAGVEALVKGELALKLLELPVDSGALGLLYLGSLRLDAFYRASCYGTAYTQAAGARIVAGASLLYPSLGGLFPLGAEIGWAFDAGAFFFHYSIGL